MSFAYMQMRPSQLSRSHLCLEHPAQRLGASFHLSTLSSVCSALEQTGRGMLARASHQADKDTAPSQRPWPGEAHHSSSQGIKLGPPCLPAPHPHPVAVSKSGERACRRAAPFLGPAHLPFPGRTPHPDSPFSARPLLLLSSPRRKKSPDNGSGSGEA